MCCKTKFKIKSNFVMISRVFIKNDKFVTLFLLAFCPGQISKIDLVGIRTGNFEAILLYTLLQ